MCLRLRLSGLLVLRFLGWGGKQSAFRPSYPTKRRVLKVSNQVKLSRFAYAYPQADAVGIFHALNLGMVFITPEQHEVVFVRMTGCERNELEQVIGAENLSILEEKGLIIPFDFDEDTLMDSLREQETCTVRLSVIYLILAERCNLACRYCFFESKMPEEPAKPMTPETAKNALDSFARWAGNQRKITVSLYGGDPLIGMSALKFAIEYTEHLVEDGQLHPDSQVSIVCNGTLITPSFISFLEKHRRIVNVSVSLDGPKDIHDQWRVDRKGRGSYYRALQGYRRLQEAGLKPAISCTLAPTSLSCMTEIVDWLISLEPNGLGFNTLVDIPGLTMDASYAKQVAEAMIYAFIRLREAGIYEDRMMRKVEAFAEEEPYLKDCAGCGRQVVVAANGDLGICHGYTATRQYFRANINQIGDFDPRQDDAYLEWNRHSPVNMPECHTCPAVGICGGGCANNAEQRHGSIWAIDDQFCPHALKTLSWMIGELYEETKTESE